MAALTFFNSFVNEAALGTHANCLAAGVDTDVVRAFLTNDTPLVGTHTTYNGEGASSGSALGSIAHANITETWPIDMTNASTQSGGTLTIAGADVTATASATVPTFRYVVLYNDTDASDKLIGYWDNGSAVDLTTGQVFTANLTTDVIMTAVA